MKNPAVAGLFCAFSLLTCAAAAQETNPTPSAPEAAPAAAVNSELEAALGTVSAAEAAEAAQQQAQPAAPAPAAASVDALSSDAASSSPSEESGQTSETPLAANNTASGEAAGEPQEYSMRMAFLLPTADSPLEGPSQTALLGLLAANYASEHPAEVLLVRPGSNGSAVDQLKAAARAGAQVAVGPLDRTAISEIAKLNYLPLPLVTLNEIELDELTPMTQDEIFAERRLREAQKNAAALEAAEERPLEAALSEKEAADNQPTGGRISNKTRVPGLVLANEIELPFYNRKPLQFPRNMLMLGMSMEHDAEYVARLGVASLPVTTEAGEKPKVLLIDHDTPLEKRVSQAFEQELIRMGFTPDRLTVDLNEFTRLRKFFELVVEKLNTDEFDEVLIDQEADPGRLASAADSHPSSAGGKARPRGALRAALLCRVPRHGRQERVTCALSSAHPHARVGHIAHKPRRDRHRFGRPRHDLRPATGRSCGRSDDSELQPRRVRADLSGSGA